jgi:ABC-type arginine transport system ATPase subunit
MQRFVKLQTITQKRGPVITATTKKIIKEIIKTNLTQRKVTIKMKM